jgi:hypothetical protein
MGTLDELHSKEAWIKAVEGMTFFGNPVSEMKEDDLRLLVGFLVTQERIMGFPMSRWDGSRSARWVRVSERLPEIGVSVLCSSKEPPGGDAVWIGQREQYEWYFPGANEMGTPTHWMPLPEPPGR